MARGAQRLKLPVRTGDIRGPHAKNGRPSGAAVQAMGTMLPVQGPGRRRSSATPTARLRSDRAVHRDRLQRDGAVGAADEHIGAEAGRDGHLAARAEIVAGEKAGSGANAVREHAPYHDAAAGDADVEPELADRPAIDLLRTGRLRRVHARHRFLRSDDEADSGRDIAGQQPSPDPLRGGWIDGRNSQCKSGSPDGVTQHLDSPFARSANPIRVACLEFDLTQKRADVAPPAAPSGQCHDSEVLLVPA